jgi:hypothetical protein
MKLLLVPVLALTALSLAACSVSTSPDDSITPVKHAPAKADFRSWENLQGTFHLQSLDGVPTSNNTIFSGYDIQQRFYDRASKRYLATFMMPLVYFSSGSSTSEYSFGPMDGLGETIMAEANGLKIFQYKYNGPLTYQGVDITLNLFIHAEKSPINGHVTLKYEIEVPGHIAKTTHILEMQ